MMIRSGPQSRPRRVLLYGQHGVGKSTWALGAPRPLFLNLEDGVGDLDCDSTPLLKSVGDVNSALSWLLTEKHDYQSVVVDSIDWFEQLLFASVASEFGKRTYEEIKFGEGKGRVIAGWQWMLGCLDELRRRGMNAVLLGHARIEKFEDPVGQAYDRYVPDLHKVSFGLVQEWVDEVFFARFRVLKNEQAEDYGRKRTVAVGGKERMVLTSESASSMAKNRLRLPDELPLNFAAYQAYWPKAIPAAKQEQQPATNPAIQSLQPTPQTSGAGVDLNGVVVNGTSKI